ncbi:hypothetical protein [Agromyces aerolatus]|uniref:hypothetical protein n=1 Tax=Agromyces sp. LY-1074 TaxID=3074080 RepID=UPI0028550AD8|nr:MULTISPECIES: hypothetical protein [unclassified Agromyces]MDR5698568.1 hypothetical protein [Agromyces sp. LY-1074]MDR5704862.1 hypothetical protein [Agromyces sp. LY-1358]
MGTVLVTLADRRTGAREEVPLARYHEWAERGPSRMRVWIPALDASSSVKQRASSSVE